MELAWAQAVCRYTGKPVLHLAPLAVSSQMVRGAEKFGIPAHLGDGEGICVTNYQKLDHFDLSKFAAVILDESRSEEHTSELQSLMRLSYAFYCLQTKNDSNVTQQIPPEK